MSDTTIQELFDRNPLEIPHTDAELDRIIERYRAAREQFKLTGKAPTKRDVADLDALDL